MAMSLDDLIMDLVKKRDQIGHGRVNVRLAGEGSPLVVKTTLTKYADPGEVNHEVYILGRDVTLPDIPHDSTLRRG